MVNRVMAEFGVPLILHNYSQLWFFKVHNYVENRTKAWKTTYEISTSHTPDLSSLRYHLWETIWCYEPSKFPYPSWIKSIWLGIEETSRDTMTYIIETEESKSVILLRSIIKSRRINRGTDKEETINDVQGMILKYHQVYQYN